MHVPVAAELFEIIVWPLALLGFVLFLVFLAVLSRYFGLWIQSKTTGAGISLLNLVLMSIRKVDPAVIVRARVMAVQSGLAAVNPLPTQALEAHYLAGGNIPRVITALVAAHRAQIPLDWQTAQAIDLAGRDVLEAVRMSVYPKVIDCPDAKSGLQTLDAVAGDGIQLMVRARVTVRTNLAQLIGGATEETIVARVGQGIVQEIGSTPTYAEVLAYPDRISKRVLNQGLESQTAFEIVSIDIADVDVGENIGARLSANQAEADMVVAQARAEERRAQAQAREHEMVAEVQHSRAQFVLAESQVPLAMAAAFRGQQLSLVDYFALKNVQADTRMRTVIAIRSGSR